MAPWPGKTCTTPSTRQPGPGAERVIKPALPTADPASLAGQLARLPALVRRTPVRKQGGNICFDTPAQALCAQRMALRLRRVGGDDAPQRGCKHSRPATATAAIRH